MKLARPSPELAREWLQPTSLSWRHAGFAFLAVTGLGSFFLGASALATGFFGGGASLSGEAIMLAVPVVLFGIHLDWGRRARLLLAAQCGIALPLFFARNWLEVSPEVEFVSHLMLVVFPSMIWLGGDLGERVRTSRDE